MNELEKFMSLIKDEATDEERDTIKTGVEAIIAIGKGDAMIVALPGEMHAILNTLIKTGLYGKEPDEMIDELFRRGLRDAIIEYRKMGL